jgi:hypothetical protein
LNNFYWYYSTIELSTGSGLGTLTGGSLDIGTESIDVLDCYELSDKLLFEYEVS